MLGAPLGCQFSLKGILQDGLAVDGQLGFCGFEGLNPFVLLGEEFFDLGNDTPLFSERG